MMMEARESGGGTMIYPPMSEVAARRFFPPKISQ